MLDHQVWLINHSILKLQIAIFDIFNTESFSTLERTDQPAAERLLKLVENNSDIEFYIKLRKTSLQNIFVFHESALNVVTRTKLQNEYKKQELHKKMAH